MAYRNESWGERDSRRWCWWIAALLVASAALGIVRLAFGIGAKLLFYSLAMLFLLIIGIAVPVFVWHSVTPTPPPVARLCSLTSLLLWRGQTSRVRASSASAPRLPNADQHYPSAGQTRDLPKEAGASCSCGDALSAGDASFASTGESRRTRIFGRRSRSATSARG